MDWENLVSIAFSITRFPIILRLSPNIMGMIKDEMFRD